MSSEEDILSKLPKSVKSVINYLLIEHVLNGRLFVPFSDIVRGTGLSSKTVRKVLKFLKEHNLIRTTVDVGGGRRILYSLALTNIRHYPKFTDVASGLYIIDIGVGVPQYLTTKTIKILRCAEYVLYTPSVPRKILDLTSPKVEECIQTPDIDLRTLLKESGVRVILLDYILDSDVASLLSKLLADHKHSDVHFIPNVNPIDVASKMLRLGIRRKVRFRRDNGIEIIVTPFVRIEEENTEYASILKCIVVRNDGISLSCVEDGEEGVMYVLYVRTTH